MSHSVQPSMLPELRVEEVAPLEECDGHMSRAHAVSPCCDMDVHLTSLDQK